jgi:hypothetical protein
LTNKAHKAAALAATQPVMSVGRRYGYVLNRCMCSKTEGKLTVGSDRAPPAVKAHERIQ